MKMNVEFNSNEELLEFISLFGAGAIQAIAEPIRPYKGVVQEVTPIQTFVAPVQEEEPVEPVKTTKSSKKDFDDFKEEANKKEIKKETKIPLEEQSTEKPTVTKTLLSTNLKKLAKSKGNAVAKGVVQEFGYNKLPEVEEKDFEALNNRMLELIRG